MTDQEKLVHFVLAALFQAARIVRGTESGEGHNPFREAKDFVIAAKAADVLPDFPAEE